MARVCNLDGLDILAQLQRQGRDENDWDVPYWPDPPIKAFYGLAGDIVGIIEPHTEADSVGLLAQLLTAFGNVVGPNPYFLVESDVHRMNLFVVLVGTSAKGRKGVSWGHIQRLFKNVDLEWVEKRVLSGLSSGEGLIWSVRDSKGEDTPGVEDKRLLVYEPEFASTLKVLTREGNTLSPVLRQAWDSGDLRILTKNSPTISTGAHISIVGHVTKSELIKNLTSTEISNGFANRFLWLCVRRSKFLPEGGRIWEVNLSPFIDRLKQAVVFARKGEKFQQTSEARKLWCQVYRTLSEGKPGLLGSVIARAEAQVMRLACLYALLDQTFIVRREHLEAAIALWTYAEQSAKFIFGETLGDPVIDHVLEALRKNPNGLTKTEIHDLFSRHRSGREIAMVLETLLGSNLVRRELERKNGGRPVEKWFVVEHI